MLPPPYSFPTLPAFCTLSQNAPGADEDGEASDDETLGRVAGAGAGAGAGGLGVEVLLTADPSLFLAEDVDGLSDLDDDEDDEDYEDGEDDDEDEDED